MYHSKLYTTIIGLLFFAPALFSQNYEKKADKQFELQAYELAVENYKLALSAGEPCKTCAFKIAESYRLLNQSLNAAIWYRKVSPTKDTPITYHYHFATVLKKMGQFDKAKEHYDLYTANDPVLGNYFSNSCDFAKIELGKEEKYDIALFKGSSRESDYGTTFLEDNIVFLSWRNDILRTDSKNTGTSLSPIGAQLFMTSPGLESKLDDVEFVRTDSDEKFDITSISYSPSSLFCAYSKSSYSRRGMQVVESDDDMHIYFSKIDTDGNLYSEQAFEYNEIGYATGFPTLSFDGKAMYFSSNRPGGMGGYDIYVSYYKDGKWTYPENLGDEVNTQGNEITPYFHDNILYFASDFHYGIGGFDIFKSTVTNGMWSNVENGGNGLNSPEDDFYPSIQPETGVFYFTSNRIGGRGNHDIFIAAPIETEIPVEEVIVSIPEETPIVEEIPEAVAIETVEEEAPTPSFVSETEEEDVKKEVISTTKEIETTPTTQTAPSTTPPAAVNLENLTKQTQVGTVSVSNAKRVSYGSVVNTSSPVYFIQLAALYHSGGTVLPFKNLVNYGNIYKLQSSSVTKIKLGHFTDQYEAERVLQSIKSEGFSDAFITQDWLSSGNMELLISKNESGVSYGIEHSNGFTSGSQYKIRLAAYEDSVWFDVNKVKDLGVIEQWSKKNWTIFVLSGYNSFEDANLARITAINRGFADAEVVLDRNGVLETIRSN